MRILINHLTRMKPTRICVAGIATDFAHVRPVLDSTQLGRDLLRSEGGPFSLGAVVDLGSTCRRPHCPEVEDVVFSRHGVRSEYLVEPVRFWELMQAASQPSLGEIFGGDLIPHQSTALPHQVTAFVPEDAGIASLGVLRAEGARLSPGDSTNGGVRLTLEDRYLGELSLPVTDIRLWERDHKTPARSRINRIRSTLEGCLVAVGLSRPFQPPGHPVPRHWLQANNIFPINDPLWATE